MFAMLPQTGNTAPFLCRRPGDAIPFDCDQNFINEHNFTPCSLDSTVFCQQSATSGFAGGNSGSGTSTALAIAGGLGFVALMWYIFRTPRSQNFNNQVRFASF